MTGGCSSDISAQSIVLFVKMLLIPYLLGSYENASLCDLKKKKKKTILFNYAFHYNLAEKDLSISLGLPLSSSMLKVYFYSKIHLSHSGCCRINQTKRAPFQFSPLPQKHTSYSPEHSSIYSLKCFSTSSMPRNILKPRLPWLYLLEFYSL